MVSEQCVRGGMLARGLSCGILDGSMSTLSVRAPGLPPTTLIDTKALRVRSITAVDNVRRNLFGCSNSEENRRFLERELAHQLELDSQRWGFDFTSESPLPGTQRYSWQLVPASTVPTALRRTPMVAPTPAAPVQEPIPVAPSPESNKAKKRITDFLKPRKRLSTSGKKSPGGHGHKHECGHIGAHIRPPKVARLAQAHFKRTS